jgi:protein-S-isoprenylcysteine O-methyltransferase Ste14
MTIRSLSRPVLTDALARVSVGVLFVLLTLSLASEFRRTGHITGLLLVGSEALVVVLTVVRRRAQRVDRSVLAAILTTASLVGPPLLRPSGVEPLASDATTAMLSAFGFAIVVYGKIALGRSFGLIPANRGVVTAGPYAIVRHPIYAGYLLTHVAFAAAHPTLINIGIILVADGALVCRALLEERVLAGDTAYRAYCSRVAWHLVPGVF